MCLHTKYDDKQAGVLLEEYKRQKKKVEEGLYVDRWNQLELITQMYEAVKQYESRWQIIISNLMGFWHKAGKSSPLSAQI